MNTLSSDDEDAINLALAGALGFTLRIIDDGNTTHTICEGPPRIGYYKLHVPQFCSGWKNLKMLVKSMEIRGYPRFELQKLEGNAWVADFNCGSDSGPCIVHGATSCNWHRATSIFGENPGQAAAFAAVLTLASGAKVTAAPSAGLNELLIKLNDIVRLVNAHSEKVKAKQHTHFSGYVVVDVCAEPTDRME